MGWGSVAQLARLLGRPFEGDGEGEIASFRPAGSASDNDLTFLTPSLSGKEIRRCRAGTLLTTAPLWEKYRAELPATAAILSDDPYGDMERLMVEVYRHPLEGRGPEIDPSAAIHPSAVVEGVVEAEAEIGPLCWVGRGARIGARCRLEAGAKVYPGVDLAEGVTLLAGAVVGSAGFGFRTTPEGKTVPVIHRAGVVVGRDSLIGALSVVAAGFLEPTELGERVALDTSVQVAHNVKIGDDSKLAAHVDLAGHCVLGKGVRMGGGAQVSGGILVEDGATLLASAGATKTIPAGETWAGFPARPLWEWRRSLVKK